MKLQIFLSLFYLLDAHSSNIYGPPPSSHSIAEGFQPPPVGFGPDRGPIGGYGRMRRAVLSQDGPYVRRMRRDENGSPLTRVGNHPSLYPAKSCEGCGTNEQVYREGKSLDSFHPIIDGNMRKGIL